MPMLQNQKRHLCLSDVCACLPFLKFIWIFELCVRFNLDPSASSCPHFCHRLGTKPGCWRQSSRPQRAQQCKLKVSWHSISFQTFFKPCALQINPLWIITIGHTGWKSNCPLVNNKSSLWKIPCTKLWLILSDIKGVLIMIQNWNLNIKQNYSSFLRNLL